jgi:hypothetical protein
MVVRISSPADGMYLVEAWKVRNLQQLPVVFHLFPSVSVLNVLSSRCSLWKHGQSRVISNTVPAYVHVLLASCVFHTKLTAFAGENRYTDRSGDTWHAGGGPPAVKPFSSIGSGVPSRDSWGPSSDRKADSSQSWGASDRWVTVSVSPTLQTLQYVVYCR